LVRQREAHQEAVQGLLAAIKALHGSELGCLPPVVIRKLNDLLAKGINPTALRQPQVLGGAIADHRHGSGAGARAHPPHL
jgi:hypothetical protein